MNLEQAKNVRANANHISNFIAGQVIEAKVYGQWDPTDTPNFLSFGPECFRVKTKPLEFWMNIYEDGKRGAVYKSREDAIGCIGKDKPLLKTIKLMEVPE